MTFTRFTQRCNELTVLVTPRPLPAKSAGLTMGPEIAFQVSWRPANEVPRTSEKRRLGPLLGKLDFGRFSAIRPDRNGHFLADGPTGSA